MWDRIQWRLRMLWAAWTLKPIRGGADDGDSDGDGKADDDKSDADAGKTEDAGKSDDDTSDDDAGDSDDGDKPSKSAEEYRTQLRQYERSAKRASVKDKKEIEKLRTDLKKREDADKSEQEKAVEAAREAGATEARNEALKDRRADRLEAASVRMASKGVEIETKDGDGDETKKTRVKFADPDDALVHLERAIGRGEIDADTVFDENSRVKDGELTELLVELLEKKPHLRESSSEKEEGKSAGDADAGKGAGQDEGGKKLEEMSVEDHLNRITRHKK